MRKFKEGETIKVKIHNINRLWNVNPTEVTIIKYIGEYTLSYQPTGGRVFATHQANLKRIA